jgi:general secretion pathway protein J
MKNVRSARGFTLLELLVATAILALVMMMAYTALQAVVRKSDGMKAHAAELRGLLFGLQLLQWDLAQAMDRPLRMRLGGEQPAFSGGGKGRVLLSLTRGGMPLVAGERSAGLAHIVYRLAQGRLMRDRYHRLDGSEEETPVSQVLIEGVDEVHIGFTDSTGRQHPAWPLAAAGRQAAPLPAALELVIRHRRWGELRRVLLVTGD